MSVDLAGRHGQRLLLALVLLSVAAGYAPRLAGFWLSDDLALLHQVFVLAEQQRLLAGTLEYFTGSMAASGAFYRPLMMLSMVLNYLLAGTWYPGWMAVNIAVHLANTALILLLVLRMGLVATANNGNATTVVSAGPEAAQPSAGLLLPAALAALLFALSPLLAEAVYWICARADAFVTLFSLLALWSWLRNDSRQALWLPLCVLLASLFKESGLVLPLLFALLAAMIPSLRTRWHLLSLAISAVLLLLLLLLRALLFGQATHVYAATSENGLLDRVPDLFSVFPWWQGLSMATPMSGGVYGLALLLLLLVLALSCLPLRQPQQRLQAALLAAGLGMGLATLLNLGEMMANGEGGRLLYTTWAWLALAAGVALTGSSRDPGRIGRSLLYSTRALALLAVASGLLVLQGLLALVADAQVAMRGSMLAAADWARQEPGMALLLVPDELGPVITGRNAQGAMVLQPLQGEGLLHRVLPTLPEEIELRHEQFANGLITRVDELRFDYLDHARVEQMFEPAPAAWPTHVMCWSLDHARLEVAALQASSDAAAWQQEVQQFAHQRCAMAL